MRGIVNVLNYWRHLATSKLLIGGMFTLGLAAGGGILMYQESQEPVWADMDLSCATMNMNGARVNCAQKLRQQIQQKVNRQTRDVQQKVQQIRQNVQTDINRASAAPDRTSNALVRGGTPNKSRAIEKFQNRPRYEKILKSFNINSVRDIRQMKQGFVTRDGRVILNGEVIATNAKNTGNHFRNAERRARVQGLGIYTAPTQQTFKVNRLQAFIKVDQNGKFVVALLKSCGNVIKAQPKQPPKPVQVCNPRNGKIITVQPNQQNRYVKKNSPKCKPVKVCVPETGKLKTVKRANKDKYEPRNSEACNPKPQQAVYECVVLEAIRQGENGDTYRFEATYRTENGANLQSAQFDFGNGSTETVEAGEGNTVTSQEVTYTEAGDYTVSAELTFSVNGETQIVSGEACETTVTVEEEPTQPEQPRPQPEQPEKQPEAPEEIPATGAASILGGTLGLSSLAGAGYYFQASRRSLRDALKK